MSDDIQQIKYVAAAAYRRGWFALVALACYAVAAVAGLLSSTPYENLLIGCSFLALIALPELLILRRARRRE